MTSLSSPVSTVTGSSPRCGSPGNEPPAFILPPRNARVSVGGIANLEGRVRGHPEPQVTWLREGRAVIGGERCVVERGGRGYFSLKVGGVREEDAGPYTCQATNQEGSRQVTVEILLEDKSMKTFFLSSSGKSGGRSSLWGESPPKFITKPSRLVVKLGESGKLIAKATGRPPPRVTWYKGEAELQSCGRVLIYERAGLHFLEIKEVSVGDAGSYSCLISNEAGNATAVTSLNIEGVPGESSSSSSVSSWRIKPPAQPPLEAVSRTAATPMQPVLSPDPERSVRDQRSSRAERRSNPRLEAPPLDQERREGSLQGCSRSKVTKVTEVRANQAPRFLCRLPDLKVMDGSAVTMTVELTGLPPPEVVWLHDEQQVSETEDFHLLRDGTLCSLMIQEVFPEDTGMYSCRASNRLGEDRTQCRLTVEEPQDGVQPWFITKPKAVRAVQGQHVLLSCAVAGDPFPGCTWARAGRPLTSGGDYELLQKEDVISLLIRRVTDLHAGEYVITLRNQVGQCSAVSCLSVTDGETDRSAGRETDRGLRGGGGGGGRGGGAVRGGEQQGSRVSRQEANEQQKKNLQQEEKTLLQKKKKKKKEEEEEDQKLHFSSFLGHRALKNHREEEEEEEVREEERQRQNSIIMDFKANLKGVKKAEDRKVAAPQVDFRAVLGKKSGAKPAEKSVEEGIKKTSPEKNGEKMAENNCVDEGLKEKKAGGKMAPEFLEKLCDVTVIDGQILRLQCRLNASDPPSVTWTLDGKTIKPSKFIVLANEGGLCSLTIGKALPEDEGEYKCRAENSAGKSESCCMVLVDDPTENSISDKKKTKAPTSESEARIKKPNTKTPPKQAVPPQILHFPEDMKILAGEKVEILCKFSGAPPITCTWLKFRKPIQEASDISIESSDSSSKLTISSGQQEHCGCYTIELRNIYSLRQAALNLTIVDKPDPPARVPASSDVRRSTLTLSWYGPTYDGGSAVQSYNLEVWDSVGGDWRHLASCNSTSYNVQDLLPERQYKFRVRAENMYGVGEPSAESTPVTVGLVDNDDEAEVEEEDEDSEKEPDYRDVSIRTDLKVKELYDVEERLGTGKFGQVFKLVEKATKKVWAGKFIKAYSAKEKDNVRHEISIMNSLHHPKLVQCIDAFEGKSDIVMVLEMISGGELFERIIDEDFELTEREVIKYMLQIIDGVNFIHKQGIVHLDLKPENIMCVGKTGSKIKLIDFGLARRLENAGTLKVLFGTPEFVAPEVINYEAISYPTDMWSIGVICYILLSGLSPFMGDNDNETLSNVTSASWDFEDDAFDEISEDAKDFITNLLKKDMKKRLTCAHCYDHKWLKQDTNTMTTKKLSKERMKKYILRRKWQKTGHAVRAIGRLSSMAMMAGVSAKKGSPTEEDNQFLECLENEQKTECKPTFSSIIKDVEVVEGSAARFDCKIEGYPDPEVVWYKDEKPIKETRHFQIDYDEEGNCSLVISEVSGDDDAKYTVKAVNSLGEATCTAELLVEVMAGEEEEEEEEEE